MLTRSMIDRLVDYAVDDLPALYGVPSAGAKAPASWNEGRVKASVVTEPHSATEQCSATAVSLPQSHMENDRPLDPDAVEQKGGPGIPPEITAVHFTSGASPMEIAHLQLVRDKIEASLKSLAQDCERRQAELSTAIDGVSVTLQNVQQRIAKELKDEAEMTVKDLLSRSTKQVREQADAVVAVSGERLRASGQEFINESEKHLSSVAETSLECLTAAAIEQTRKQLSQMLDEFLSKGTSLAQDCERRQVELSSSIDEASATLQNVRQRIAKELSDEAETTVKYLLSRSTEQVREQADAVVAASGERLRALYQGFIEETEKNLSSVAQNSPVGMTEKDRVVSRETVGTDGLEFTTEEKQRIADLLEEARSILSKATKRQSNSAATPKSYRQSAS